MHHLVGMAEIAEMLGVSRQRVAQIVESYEDFPAPEVDLGAGRVWSRTAVETWIAAHPDRGPGRPAEPAKRKIRRAAEDQRIEAFSRFTDDARQVIIRAQEEARLMSHNHIGTEHLLVALFEPERSAAARALVRAGMTADVVRERIRTMIGPGTEAPAGHIPFTPRTQKVLELSLREALHLGSDSVGTEHVLLGLIREGEGVAWRIMAEHGLAASEAREAVLEVIASTIRPPVVEARKPSTPTGLSCSFCGKHQDNVQKLIAGPGVYICDECVALCNDILEQFTRDDTETGLAARVSALEARLAELEQPPRQD